MYSKDFIHLFLFLYFKSRIFVSLKSERSKIVRYFRPSSNIRSSIQHFRNWRDNTWIVYVYKVMIILTAHLIAETFSQILWQIFVIISLFKHKYWPSSKTILLKNSKILAELRVVICCDSFEIELLKCSDKTTLIFIQNIFNWKSILCESNS